MTQAVLFFGHQDNKVIDSGEVESFPAVPP